jgi:hypothetical protein
LLSPHAMNRFQILLAHSVVALLVASVTNLGLMRFAAHAQSTPSVPTFNSNVAPIIFSKCTPCHRTGEVAPFTLLNYTDARRRATQIKAVTQAGSMPPWKPIRGYGEFADARGLSSEEIAVLAAWADAGAPEGDPARTPVAPTFPSGSQLGTPDLVIKMPLPFTVKGVSKDEYRNFVVPTGLLDNKIVSAVEFRPGNPKVVHHALLSLDTSGQARRLDANDAELGYEGGGGGAGFIPAETYQGWVPGATARFLPKGVGVRMDKGSDMVLQVHYAPSATQEQDQSLVNVYFMKDTANVRLLSRITPMNPTDITGGVITGFASFMVPPAQQRTFVGRRRVPSDFSLIAIAPHQHLIGRTAKAYAVTPSRDTIPLLAINDWDFAWQGQYTFKKMIKIPARSEIVYEASYDNTSSNFRNPNNPPKLVRWGENTSDEMFLCYTTGLPYQAGDENISLETPQPQALTSVHDEPPYPIGAVNMTVTIALAPNPAVERSQATFTLPESGLATLDVLSAQGASVLTVFAARQFSSGSHSIPIELGALPAGQYFCRLTVRGRSFVQPIVVAR